MTHRLGPRVVVASIAVALILAAPMAVAQSPSPAPAATVPSSVPASPSPAAVSSAAIYWGASMVGFPDDVGVIDAFEAAAGRKMSLIDVFSTWGADHPTFDPAAMDIIRGRGALPMVTWEPWRYEAEDPEYTLASIIDGSHDEYIIAWAKAAAAWGHPFFLRFAQEMNGNWTPWSERVNGNKPHEFIAAWIHVHDIFTRLGATNVTWVWCPNPEDHNSAPLERLYPGDTYVDWVGLDIYDWGLSQPWSDWETFDHATRPSYEHLTQVAPGKPVMLAELGATELGGDKAHWIRDAIGVQIPQAFPMIRAVIWFEFVATNTDWRIVSSSESAAAFAASIASDRFASNDYATWGISPIPALPFAPLPTPAPDPTRDPAVNMLGNGSFDGPESWLYPWQLNVSIGGRADITPESQDVVEAPNALRVGVKQANSVDDWVVELDENGIALTLKGTYTLTLSARAALPRTIRLSIQADYAPFDTYWSQTLALTPAWQSYTFTISPGLDEPDGQVVFNLGGSLGTVWLDRVTFRREPGPPSASPVIAAPSPAVPAASVAGSR